MAPEGSDCLGLKMVRSWSYLKAGRPQLAKKASVTLYHHPAFLLSLSTKKCTSLYLSCINIFQISSSLCRKFSPTQNSVIWYDLSVLWPQYVSIKNLAGWLGRSRRSNRRTGICSEVEDNFPEHVRCNVYCAVCLSNLYWQSRLIVFVEFDSWNPWALMVTCIGKVRPCYLCSLWQVSWLSFCGSLALPSILHCYIFMQGWRTDLCLR